MATIVLFASISLNKPVDAAKVDFKDPVSFEYDIHSVSGVLKLFLRTLPVSLLINDCKTIF